jgi:hypothetical protein
MGPNHFAVQDGGAVCSICGSKNPLGNLKRLSIQEVKEPCETIVCFTQAGKAAHALHIDCKTVLGPWLKFQSAETLDRALVYLGAADDQMKEHRATMGQTGQGSSHITRLPLRKNLLRIAWEKL